MWPAQGGPSGPTVAPAGCNTNELHAARAGTQNGVPAPPAARTHNHAAAAAAEGYIGHADAATARSRCARKTPPRRGHRCSVLRHSPMASAHACARERVRSCMCVRAHTHGPACVARTALASTGHHTQTHHFGVRPRRTSMVCHTACAPHWLAQALCVQSDLLLRAGVAAHHACRGPIVWRAARMATHISPSTVIGLQPDAGDRCAPARRRATAAARHPHHTVSGTTWV